MSNDHEAIARDILSRIEKWSFDKYDEPPRKHLGASEIGSPCLRQLWYKFRWFHSSNDRNEEAIGRKLRLFNRGHREESSVVEILIGIGCKIETSQMRVSDVDGHFGGSLDAIGYLPKEYGIFSKVLFEFKTMNDSNFKSLKRDGIEIAQPKHFSQIQTYGYKAKLEYAVYVVVNKNDDEIFIQIIKIDPAYGEDMVRKAHHIITSLDPPAKITLTATDFRCKYCKAKEICHYDAEALKNCRSCWYSEPAANGEWFCKKHEQNIPETFIPTGCEHWTQIGKGF